MPIENSPARATVRIPTSSGDELEAWLYLPAYQSGDRQIMAKVRCPAAASIASTDPTRVVR